MHNIKKRAFRFKITAKITIQQLPVSSFVNFVTRVNGCKLISVTFNTNSWIETQWQEIVDQLNF